MNTTTMTQNVTSPAWASPRGQTPIDGHPAPSGNLIQWKRQPNRQRRRRPAQLLVKFGLLAVALGLSLLIDSGVLFAVVALFVLIVPFEKLYPRQKGQKIRRPLAATDIGFAVLSPVLNVAGITAIVIIGGLSLFWLPGLALRSLVNLLPGAALPFVGFVVFDFISYWTHRWSHEVPFLWRFHAVHHSPEHMDWISGFRVHPFDSVLIAPAFFFLIGAGFGAEVTGVLAILQVVLGLFFHANVRVRWRWLDKLVANPEFHHWHHANEPDSIGHNYAPALPQWDLLFGTFFMPTSNRRPRRYGVDDFPARSMGALLTYPCRGARKHVSLLWHPVRAAKLGWHGTKQLLSDIKRSTRRPTHSVKKETVEGCQTTNETLFTSPRTLVK